MPLSAAERSGIRIGVRKSSLISRSLGSRTGSMAVRFSPTDNAGLGIGGSDKTSITLCPDLIRASTSCCRPPKGVKAGVKPLA
jgi:hypothetical protein